MLEARTPDLSFEVSRASYEVDNGLLGSAPFFRTECPLFKIAALGPAPTRRALRRPEQARNHRLRARWRAGSVIRTLGIVKVGK